MRLVDVLREKGVYNSYDLLEHGEFLVTFTSYHGQGRFPVYFGWHLHKKGFKFKDQPWYTHGTLPLDGQDRADRDKALAHAAKRTGARTWLRDPFGAWHPADQLRARLAALGVKAPRMTEVTV